MSDDLPYRPAVGIMLLDARDRVFVAQRIDTALEAWQMPQGGIDKGEAPREAVLRELEEETGIAPDRVEILACAARELHYDLPADLQRKVWGGRYRGQAQTWYLARYLGRDDEIDLNTPHPEFRAWRWVEPEDLIALIVPFKRELYAAVLAEFASRIGR